MKKILALMLLAAVSMLALAGLAQAAEHTVVLTLPDMDCGSKIMKVSWFLQDFEGVTKSKVDQNDPIATVTYDDGKTTIEAIKEGLAQEGFPVSAVTPQQ